MPKKILFTAVKNEAPFLLEWIAYHRSIGFDTIIIVSNDSDDGTTELLDALQAAGELHHIHHSVGPNQSPQGKAALAANASGLIEDGDWVIWLDADEFLNIHTGDGKLGDLIAAVDDASGMIIPWRLFGDGGNDGAGPWRFVSDGFTGAASLDNPLNWQLKTFYRHGDGRTKLAHLAPHRPALTRGAGFTNADFITPAGQPIDGTDKVTKNWLGGVTAPGNAKVPPADLSWEIAQINHYSVRTGQLFGLKRYRGRGFRGKRKTVGVRHTERFFQNHNLNDCDDRSILRHETSSMAELNRLLAIDDVRIAHERGQKLTAERIAAMNERDALEPVADPMASDDAVDAAPALFVPGVTLPDAEQALLEREYAQHDVILEYGSGGSTLLAAQQEHALVMSVESDAAWADNMRAVLQRDYPDAPVRIHTADIGPTKKWGRPANEQSWRKFPNYPMQVWDMDWFRHPDLILIDGRFRVGCFLNALFRIERPVTVLFDDYATGRHYAAAVEAFVKPRSIVGRMARFEIEPTALPPARLTEIISLILNPE
ncbi:MAG: glycosyltransferase family 2 protein [Paracoccus denitrificans]|uniref:Glycosyltransferase family 2 protein n=1 Tax=Paracoccus denitrificans TaxID=266 RepID=A0A533I1L5_PARDE|nr:MAG: glycosyltransferase family 2 protein [Paracoccus denitrificans]